MSATSDTSRITASRWFPPVADQAEGRIGFWLTTATAVVVVLVAVVYLAQALQWRSQPFIGALVTRTLTVDGSVPVDPASWSGLSVGLQRGDHITAINGETFSTAFEQADAEFATLLSTLQPGDTISVDFERLAVDGVLEQVGTEVCSPTENDIARCGVRLPLMRFPDADFLADFVIPYVSAIVSISIGILLIALRRFKQTAQVVAVVCLMIGIFSAGLFDLNTTFTLSPFWIIATSLGGGAFVMTAFLFPIKLPVIYRRPGIQYVPLVASWLIAALILMIYMNPPSPQAAVTADWLAPLAAVAGLIIFVGVLLRRRSSAALISVRDQVNTVLIGVLLALAVVALWLIDLALRPVVGATPITFNTSAAMPFFILPPLSMAYAVLQYRSLDTDRIISQGITYLIMLSALLIGYFLLVFSAALIVGEAIGPSNPILLAILIFLMAVLFVPVRTRLQARIDEIYFRKRINYQTSVENFGQRLSSLVEFSDILGAYRAELSQTLLPTQIFVFLSDRQSGDYVAAGTDVRFTPDSTLVAQLATGEGMLYLEPGQPWNPAAIAERSRLLLLKATVLVGMRGANRLIGFVCIAPPRSMSTTTAGRYTVEELRFVQSLTTQISVAVERAQVVEALEHRVRELDVLSQVSQAVNFTLGLDDLLELIYAQTYRLIDATHFYITLRDAVANEIYFAFFLEGGERYTERENRRWNMGNDLFSEVIRSGQPLVVTDYAQTLADRGGSLGDEDAELHGWMGVPLLAGSRTIGMMAVGATQSGRVYRDDQRKIFTDIGAMAATSLDKARLFAETNARARQLTALNAITQQIVAAELDLERLLQLITASATDILGAQAGSLLLTVDDGSGDLEFKVAIGGSGEEVLGSHLQAGRGLVGEVAATGKPVIVNDAGSDPRWGGELNKGQFHTTTVLAVPLMTQNRVIGVLEVLNKQTGTIFNRDDLDLLTAFAGQAAVAIENARLFQLTDFQLSERVGELEMLERIDVELNRSLDLAKVAEISLHWALENTSAEAGFLGVVVGEPVHLEIIAKIGYGEDDLPLGAEGTAYPLDRGIVSRVLRTRQPDLVPDVSIDPNYIPSLRGGMSQITLPMLSGGAVNAIIVLETNQEPRLRLADMPFLQRLTEHASIAIANAQLYAELTRANQSKSEFVSFVAHELKNPLTSIQGYSDVLLKGAVGEMSEQQKNFLGTIRFNAQRMNTLVSDLNDVTKLQTDNMRMILSPVDFHKALEETLRPFERQISDKGQTLELKMDEDLPLIHADQNRLIQVLTNMISNAHKYTPEDGVIRISAVVNTTPRDNKGRLLPPQLHVSVTDTGIGMSEEDLNKLFTPYFRSENPLTREQPGTGLGLTITRGIIQAHGGDVWVESELGVGTTFHFTIPLEIEAEQAGD